MFTDINELQPRNADFPIEVTPSGIFTDVSELQPSNALDPIDVTLDGSRTEFKHIQLLKLGVFVKSHSDRSSAILYPPIFSIIE